MLALPPEMFGSSDIHETNNLPSSFLSWCGWLLMIVGGACIFVGYRQWPAMLLVAGGII